MQEAAGLLIRPKKSANMVIPRRTVIIGCGGIGSHLWDFLAHETWCRADINQELDRLGRHADKKKFCSNFLLIDNDSVEQKNLYRQSYFEEHVGLSKAEALASKYRHALSRYGVGIDTEQCWIDEDSNLFRENDLVLLCVDNNATRKMISTNLKNNMASNITLVSGGNRGTLVTVQLLNKARSEINTASLEHMHPEITTPEDKHPRDTPCTDRTAAVDDPQLFRANLMAATQMFQIWANALDRKPVDFCELWMDIGNQSYRKELIPDKEIIANE